MISSELQHGLVVANLKNYSEKKTVKKELIISKECGS